MVTVTLDSGEQIPVHPVPAFALAEVESHYRVEAPPPPDSSERQDWEQQAVEVARQREAAVTEAVLLIALRDVPTPDDWEFPDYLRNAGVTPREGERGRRLDWLQYGLLVTPRDIAEVARAAVATPVRDDAIQSALAMFPGRG